MILPYMDWCSRLPYISFLGVSHMVLILKKFFSLISLFQLLYMSRFSPCNCLYFWFSWVHYSSSKEKDSSRNKKFIWIHGFSYTKEPRYCCCIVTTNIFTSFFKICIPAYFWGGVFPMRFSPVSSVVLSNIFYYLLDCIWVTYGLVTKAHNCPS